LTSSTPHAAWIPTESDFSPISSVGSSHSRLTSAQDNEEASLLGYPPISLVDSRKEKETWPYILALKSAALRSVW